MRRASEHAGQDLRLAVILNSASDSGAQSGNSMQKRSVDDLLAPFSTAARQFNPQKNMAAAAAGSSSSWTSSAVSSPSSAPKVSDYAGKCFTSKKALEKATASCSGRGTGVEARLGGRTCYRCQCKADRSVEGRVTYFAGEACEKVDLSSPFVLLATTTVVLLVLVAGSIKYMVGMGSEKLPGTLASVSVPQYKL